MECQSYFPEYRLNYDLNLDVNGGARPIQNINGAFQSGRSSKYVLPSPVPQGHLELLRQTILMQEATFSDQVQELHRLYKRQTELMCELKSKELYMNHIHLENQFSNSFSKYSSGSVQNTPHSLPLVNLHCKPAVGAYHIQTPMDFVKELRMCSSSIVSRDDTRLNNLHFSEFKGRKIGSRFLDLELPAEVYIDSDDRESLEDAKLPETPMPTAEVHSNEPSKVLLGTRSISSFALQGGFLCPGSFARSSTGLADLNEPKMESCLGKNDEIVEKFLGHEVDHASPELFSGSYWERTSASMKNNNPCVVQALPCLANQIPSGKGAKLISRIKGHNIGSRCMSMKRGSETNSKNSVVSLSSLTSDHLMNVTGLIDLNSDVVANTEFTPSGEGKGNDIRMKQQSDISSVNSQGSETLRKSKKCRLIDINLPYDIGTEEEPVIDDDDQVGGDDKKVVREIDLEAPPSPEVEECPPPRGDSEENHQEDVDAHFLELAKFAAEAIVSISSCSKSETYHESRDNGTLEWFAGLIDSICHDTENHDAHKLDEFEAMTLELTEMKEEEYWCKSNTNSTQIENFTCLTDTQTRKGRTRRSKRKDFQREVLPSLASLSRYEVTEDIQMIEGLMEDAGTPWHLTRERRACRKPRAAKQGALMSWVEPTRRPRRPRNPARPSVVLTRWLQFSHPEI